MCRGPCAPTATRSAYRCDAVVEIPVFGVKNSLNVACCASIVLYEVLRRWGKFAAAPQAAPAPAAPASGGAA